MRIALGLLALAACDKSAPPRDAAALHGVAWTLHVDVTHPALGVPAGDTITLDAIGDLRHTDFGADLGAWHVLPDRMHAVADLVRDPDLLAPPVPSDLQMGDAPQVVVSLQTPAGVAEKRYQSYRTPPSIAKLRDTLDALVAEHDLENLAAAGPFTVGVGGTKIDSRGATPRAALARIATVLLSPDLATVPDEPDLPQGQPPPPEITFVIERGGTTRRIEAAIPALPVLEALDRAVQSAQ